MQYKGQWEQTRKQKRKEKNNGGGKLSQDFWKKTVESTVFGQDSPESDLTKHMSKEEQNSSGDKYSGEL